MSQTELLYYFDPATAGTATALSVGKDAERDYVILDRTLFHPAGGGQKSDLGTIAGVPVVKAERREAEVFHFLGAEPRIDVASVVPVEVDAAARLLNSQWHTAGHLVGSVMERVLGCKATGGQHWPGESFIVSTPSGRQYFGKLFYQRDAWRASDETLIVLEQLRDAGIDRLTFPLRTSNGGRSVYLGERRMVLFAFIKIVTDGWSLDKSVAVSTIQGDSSPNSSPGTRMKCE